MEIPIRNQMHMALNVAHHLYELTGNLPGYLYYVGDQDNLDIAEMVFKKSHSVNYLCNSIDNVSLDFDPITGIDILLIFDNPFTATANNFKNQLIHLVRKVNKGGIIVIDTKFIDTLSLGALFNTLDESYYYIAELDFYLGFEYVEYNIIRKQIS